MVNQRRRQCFIPELEAFQLPLSKFNKCQPVATISTYAAG